MENQELVNELRNRMKYEPVHFKYKKKNGEVREAYGTLNLDKIIEDGGEAPKGIGKPGVNMFPYWDLNSQGWRCFINENLIEIEKDNQSKIEFN